MASRGKHTVLWKHRSLAEYLVNTGGDGRGRESIKEACGMRLTTESRNLCSAASNLASTKMERKANYPVCTIVEKSKKHCV